VGTGTLLLNGANGFAGATLLSNGTLGGTGSVAGAVSVLPGAVLAPGVSGAGTFAVGGNLGFDTNSTYAWNFDGTNSDLTTAATLQFGADWTLAVGATATLTNGDYLLISAPGGVSGFVAPTITGATGVVSVVGGSNVVLTVAAAVLTPFQTWQTNYFGSTTNLAAAYDADPDGDGYANLLEYAFGSNPTLGGSVNAPASGTSGDYLTITVPRNADATDISYEVQGSSNLLDWVTNVVLTATNPAPAGVTVTYTNATPFSALPTQFLRVKVTQP
jgi:autotransporter-associated beta strand protein